MRSPEPILRLFRVFVAPEAATAVGEVLASGQIAQGPVVDAFESELAEFFGSPALTVSSGTAALDLALHLCDVRPGDDVVTTAMTCSATNNGIVLRGATPVFVDIDPATGLIDPEDVRRNLTPRTKAIVAVDWAGHPCDYSALKPLGIPVIEDAAHAVGTIYEGHHVASTGGDFVCFSFQAIKHLTTGDGGAIVVPPSMVERARRLRWFGLDRRSNARFRFEQDITEIGYKYHLNDIAAAVGRANLRHLPTIVKAHRDNAAWLASALAGVPRCQVPRRDARSSWWLFTLRVTEPGNFISRMAEFGVECSPVHSRNDRATAFRRASRSSARLSGLDEFSARQVSVPVGWWLSQTDLERIARAVEACTQRP